MTLDETCLTWLMAEGVDAREDDLAQTYGFKHRLNESRALTRCRLEPPEPPERLSWHVEFYAAEEAVLEVPLARLFEPRGEDCTGAVARIVLNATFYLLPIHQRSGFARALYEAEEALYRRWGVREVHIEALRSGPLVWIKKFGYQPRDPEPLLIGYPSWARSRAGMPTYITRVEDLPDAYLAQLDHVSLYKVIR